MRAAGFCYWLIKSEVNDYITVEFYTFNMTNDEDDLHVHDEFGPDVDPAAGGQFGGIFCDELL